MKNRNLIYGAFSSVLILVAITLLQAQKVFSFAPVFRTIQASPAVFTGTADVQIFAAAGAGIRNYVTQLSIGNGAGAEGTVTIKDGTTTIMQFRIHSDESAYITFPSALRGSANTAINIASDNTSLSLNVGASGFTSAE